MLEIIKNIIDLCNIFINKIFKFRIDFSPGFTVSMGELIIGFLIVVLTVYFILKGLGVITKGDDD